MALLLRINQWLTRLFAAGAGLSMALVFVIIFFNALRRYTLGKSLEWGEEAPIYLAIYGVMFGMAFAYSQDRHIRFTILVDFLNYRVRQWIFVGVDIVMIAVGASLAWSGWLFMEKRGKVEASGIIGTAKDLSTSLGAQWVEAFGHMAVWQFAFVLGGVLLTLAALFKSITRTHAILNRELSAQ